MDELESAPPRSYDEIVAGDIVEFRPELRDRFDLVVSWQVLEHVRPLSEALENIRRYLVPGGTFVAQLSGRFSVFALVNRLIPRRVGLWALASLLGRNPHSVFPAYYDQCWHDALVRLTSHWHSVEILPRYAGSGYLAFIPPLQRTYRLYENWLARRNYRNLATHYLISARR
jgi:SAM-dependent methyltransferase